MNIRKATKDDESFIKQIYKESKNEIGSFNLFKSWDNYLNRETTYNFYILEGKGFLRYGYSPRKKCYVIKEIGILKEFQGKGIGKILFDFCKRPLYLTCNIDNLIGNKFYKKMGMKFKGVIPTKNGKNKMNVWVI